MKYGLSDDQLSEIIRFIEKYPEVERAILFGSRAMDTYKEASDVDIAILGDQITADLAAKIKFDLEEDTYLPFYFDIIAYPTITNEALKHHINRKGVVVFRRGWKQVKLSDVALKFAMGPFGSNIKAENFVSSGVPVIRGTNLNFYRYVDGKFVYLTNEKANQLKSSNCFPGDIVVTHRGTLGQVSLIPEKKYDRYVISQSGMKVTVNPVYLDNRFLLYFFKSDIGQHELLKHESQVGVPSISNPLTSLKSVELKLPSLLEQKVIAAILSSLDDKIDLLHRQNKTLEGMAEALFRQWFVEGAEVAWPEVRIFDFVELNRLSMGQHYPYKVIEYLDTGSLNAGNFEGFQSLPLSEAPSRAKRLVQHNDILISTVRPDQKHYGIIKNPIENLVVSTGFCVLTCTKIDPHFIYLLLTTSEMTDYLHTIAEGSTSTYPSLKPSDIGAISFQLPPDGKLEAFSAIARNSWDKIEKNYIQIRILEKLRDGLLPKLMSGEVRVLSDLPQYKETLL